jgi:ABC-2 type transport system ATP-binding protein
MLVVRGRLDLDVEQGEIAVLQGDGAAELLHGLATRAPLEGVTATIDGFDVTTEAEAVRARIGLVDGTHHQHDLVARGMSYGLPRAVAEERAVYLLQSLHVRGPGWRLALALALVHEPRVLFVDAPPAEAWPLLERLSNESQLAIVVHEPLHDASKRPLEARRSVLRAL